MLRPTLPLLLLLSIAGPARADVGETVSQLDQALTGLEGEPSDALWAKALSHSQALLADPAGVDALYERVGRLQAAGVFADSPWENPARLQPRFVRGTLAKPGGNAVREALSCLRVAAIAKGDLTDERFPAERATAFLTQTFALNLDLVFPTATEETRRDRAHLQGVQNLFDVLSRRVGLDGLGDMLGREIAATCAQRPIVTTRVRQILARVSAASLVDHATLGPYVRAIRGPSPLARQHAEPADYRAALERASPEALAEEARQLGAAMQATGLVGAHHAAFVQHAAQDAGLLTAALDLQARGKAELEQHGALVADLIQRGVHQARPQAVFGLAGLLERGRLSQADVRAGLTGLFDLEVCEASGDLLTAWWKAQGVQAAPMNEQALLVSGALSVLGQPLGVSQGQNQTCQSARGISLWGQRDPAYLLACLTSVVRDDVLVLPFEDEELRSDTLKTHRVEVIGGLDPVSALLTPHIDRLYGQIMKRVRGRSSDAHRWANPGLYGGWIPDGFSSCFTGAAGTVRDHGDFVRALYATFHPDYNAGREPVTPNPVGIVVTDGRGKFVGLHAVSLLRVAKDPQGEVRVYFFNPNGEDRQDWGQGIRTQVAGHGEEPGESSLPFADFATRIYAFHHHPTEQEAEVPDEVVQAVSERARASWGKRFRWSRSDGR
jgi:hypothetical protein